jgi:hypothetical protein
MIDLDALRSRHPELAEALVQALSHHAAIALERRHAPGVELSILIDGELLREALSWSSTTKEDALMVDARRATEEGAECIALALVGRFRRWRIVRRLQPGESADWLLADEAGQRIVLEISGTDDGPFEPRVRQKRGQAALASARGRPAVSVVRFLEPKAMLEERGAGDVP